MAEYNPRKIQSDLEGKETKAIKYMGKTFVNVTSHDIHLVSKSGDTIIVPKSGFTVSARETTRVVDAFEGGITISSLFWAEDPIGRIKLNILIQRYPDSIILGSKIAAQGYPGEICFCKNSVPEYFLEKRPNMKQTNDPVFYLDSLTIILE